MRTAHTLQPLRCHPGRVRGQVLALLKYNRLGKNAMKQYPMLGLIMRWGAIMAALIAAIVVAASIWASVATGNWLWAAAGLVLAGVGYCVAVSYVELIRLITDMLLPK